MHGSSSLRAVRYVLEKDFLHTGRSSYVDDCLSGMAYDSKELHSLHRYVTTGHRSRPARFEMYPGGQRVSSTSSGFRATQVACTTLSAIGRLSATSTIIPHFIGPLHFAHFFSSEGIVFHFHCGLRFVSNCVRRPFCDERHASAGRREMR